jgi:hypothetical protein
MKLSLTRRTTTSGQPSLTPQSIDEVCRTYFLSM